MPELLDALVQRRARRAFDPQPVPPEVEELLWRAVSLAPSHGNTQPTRIVVARSPEARAGLEAALSEGNRGWAPAAPLLVAFCTVPEHSPPQVNSDGSERPLWGFNAGIAAGNLMAQATAMGLVAHPMAGVDEVKARSALGIPESVRVMVAIAIGYPGPVESLPEDLQKRETGPQRRMPLENFVAEDRWTEAQGVNARDVAKR